ncbi:MspA family porin [Nocardia mikamii]|uniref:MspA family porin n=1 Tax=Nocardia mikamii TaxID=508464 RepID=UPI0009FDC1C6|nr:MspA family porin [Nocardia mikamii]
MCCRIARRRSRSRAAEEGAVSGVPARIVMRDIHLVVNGCIGRAVVRQYTLMQLHTDSLDDVGVVYGDPLWI